MTNTDIKIFQSDDGNLCLEVPVKNESVWLNEQQISILFGRDRSVINKHIRAILSDEEWDFSSNVQNLHIANSDKPVRFYSLDIIISVGYRVKSPKGILFRKWANSILKQHLIEGYTLNQKRLMKRGIGDLQSAISLLAQTLHHNDLLKNELASDLLHIIEQYAKTWDVLLKYDETRLDPLADSSDLHDSLSLKNARKYILEFKNELVKVGQASDFFGKEKDEHFSGILACLDQTFGGIPLYKSTKERAAHLLYMIIKDHPFLDGNKRIGSFLFTIYLARAQEPTLDPRSLTSLTLLIAESAPCQKKLMVNLILTFIQDFS